MMQEFKILDHDAGVQRTDRLFYVASVLISLTVLMIALALTYTPAVFDLPITRLINGYANKNALLDIVFFDLHTYTIFSGTILMAAAWSCWFGEEAREARPQILVGVLLSFPIGIASRYLQYNLHTHSRPFYDNSIGFRPPSISAGSSLNTWNSFPSDHAAVFGALVVVICIARPKLGWLLIPWFILVELARNYIGAHYPSDLMGGAALAATIIFAARAKWVTAIGQRMMEVERDFPRLFYFLAFFVSLEISILFWDVRSIFKELLLLHHLR